MATGLSNPEVTWEVWRSHDNGSPDVQVAGRMSARQARDLLRACIEDTLDIPQISFYRVKATTTRERWIERYG